jgi:hypothetical protein
VAEASPDLLSLRILLRAVEKTLAERDNSARDRQRLRQLRDRLRRELLGAAARWN